MGRRSVRRMKVTYSTAFVRISDEFEVADAFELVSTDPKYPVDFELEARFVDGEYRCTSIRLVEREGGEGVKGSSLRALPIDAILRRGARLAMRVRTPGEAGVIARGPTSHDDLAAFDAAVRKTRPRRSRGVDDDFLRRVASVYRAALAAGQPPAVAVAKALHGSRSSAGRWVMQARAKGFLGAAVQRRAGEVSEGKTSKRTKRRN